MADHMKVFEQAAESVRLAKEFARRAEEEGPEQSLISAIQANTYIQIAHFERWLGEQMMEADDA